MTNTSATGGVLAPLNTPLTQTQIENLLQGLIAGITGLTGTLVRPRWQPEPPKQPAHDVDWCSLGIQTRARHGSPAVTHDGTGSGTDVVLAWERLELLTSFYGPGAQDLISRLLSGLAVDQNRTALRSAGLAYLFAGEPVVAPELIQTRWVQRVDLTLFFELEVRRDYSVLTILCGLVTINTDTGLDVQTVPMTGEEV